jgi:hypothetical protein
VGFNELSGQWLQARALLLSLLPTAMNKPRARTFSSFGKVSRPALTAAGALTALFAVSAFVVAHAGAKEMPGETVDAARQLLSAAEGWQTEHADGCPTISQLVEDGKLDESDRTDDAWGNRFRIICDGSTTSVRSAGPDRRPGTPDDMNVAHGS